MESPSGSPPTGETPSASPPPVEGPITPPPHAEGPGAVPRSSLSWKILDGSPRTYIIPGVRGRTSPSGGGESIPSASPDHRETLEAVTRRMSTETLGQSGIKNFRILDETRLREVLERMVEARVNDRLARELRATPPAPAAPPRMAPGALRALREDYRERWQRFRLRFEARLRSIEEKATRLASSPPRGR